MANETQTPEHMALFVRLQRQIELYFKKNKNADFYADAMREDTIKLNRIAVECSGKTIQQMIGDRVVKEAQTLLQDGLVYNDIAHILGFSSPDYFTNYLIKFPEGKGVFNKAIFGSEN